MPNVWCVLGGVDGRAEALATSLITGGHSVAIPSPDVSPLAMLVNRHRDSILPVEIDAADEESLRDAVAAIEESYGEIEAFAILVDSTMAPDVAVSARAFANLRTDAAIVIVTGNPDEDEATRDTRRMVNATAEAGLKRMLADHDVASRRLRVVEFSDINDYASTIV